jgi:hypothetical protein
VGPRRGLDCCGRNAPTGIRSPEPPACSKSLYRLRYHRETFTLTFTGLGGCVEEKHFLSLPGFEPRIVQSVASRCTHYASSPEIPVLRENPVPVPLFPPLIPHLVALLKLIKICVHFRILTFLRSTACVMHQPVNIQEFYIQLHCLCVFCIYLRTNSDYCPIQHKLI